MVARAFSRARASFLDSSVGGIARVHVWRTPPVLCDVVCFLALALFPSYTWNGVSSRVGGALRAAVAGSGALLAATAGTDALRAILVARGGGGGCRAAGGSALWAVV